MAATLLVLGMGVASAAETPQAKDTKAAPEAWLGVYSQTLTPELREGPDVQQFVAHSRVGLAVGWRAIEIYPILGNEYWQPEYAAAIGMISYGNRARYARKKDESGLSGKLRSFLARASM